MPEQAHEGEDAAYDIVATSRPTIHGERILCPIDNLTLWKNVKFIEYETNLYIAPVVDASRVPENFETDISGALCGVIWKNVGVQYHTQLYPRSSVSKYNLVLANSVGVVDTGYRSQILVRFKYLFQPEDYIVMQEDMIRVYGRVNNEAIYQQGDKIVQIKAFPNVPIQFETVDTLPDSKRNLGGFGSSGK